MTTNKIYILEVKIVLKIELNNRRITDFLFHKKRETSILGQRKYGENKQGELKDKSILSSRKFAIND